MRYEAPSWPNESFFLLSVEEGWTIGPFTPTDWGASENGSVVWADGYTHPVTLRIRGQEGDVIHANDGSVREMDYRIVPLSKVPPDWIGEA